MERKFLQKKENGKITKTKEMVEQSASTKEVLQNLTKEEMEKKKKELEHYYVPYEVEALQDGFEITIFPENLKETNQLAIKYEIHNRKQMIILASTKKKNIQANRIRKTLNQYFGEKVQKFASLQELEPEYYIEDLIKQGWELTSEGLDLFCTVRNDGEIELKRTEFTNSELANITKEEIQENKRRHNLSIEHQVIEGIPDYIVKSYKQITSEDIKQMASTTSIEKVLKLYKMVFGYVNNQEQNELVQIFRNMKPILDAFGNSKPTLDVTKEQQALISQDMEVISRCMNQIPEQYKDNEKHQQILQYIIIRKVFIKERQKGEIGKQEEEALNTHIARIDEQEEKKKEATRDSMRISTKTLMARHNRGIEK